jgi:hypothetical protein
MVAAADDDDGVFLDLVNQAMLVIDARVAPATGCRCAKLFNQLQQSSQHQAMGLTGVERVREPSVEVAEDL